MTHVPHELAADFPELTDKIHTLKTPNYNETQCNDSYFSHNTPPFLTFGSSYLHWLVLLLFLLIF